MRATSTSFLICTVFFVIGAVQPISQSNGSPRGANHEDTVQLLAWYVRTANGQSGLWPGEQGTLSWISQLSEMLDEYSTTSLKPSRWFDRDVVVLVRQDEQITLEYVRDDAGTITDAVVVDLGRNGIRDPGGYDDYEVSAWRGELTPTRPAGLSPWLKYPLSLACLASLTLAFQAAGRIGTGTRREIGIAVRLLILAVVLLLGVITMPSPDARPVGIETPWTQDGRSTALLTYGAMFCTSITVVLVALRVGPSANRPAGPSARGGE